MPNGTTDQQISLALARITGYPLADIELKNRDGVEWTYSTSRMMTSYVVLTLESLRGGMDPRWEARSRSRSREQEQTMGWGLYHGAFLGTVQYRDQSLSSSSPQMTPIYREMDEAYQRERMIRESLREELREQPCVQSPPPRHMAIDPDIAENVPVTYHL